MRSSSGERRVDFDKAKELSLSEFLSYELGVKGRRVASGMRFGSCPACGQSDNKASTKLSISKDDRAFYCHSCGAKGNIIYAASLLWGCSEEDATDKLNGVSSRPKAVLPKRDPKKEQAEQAANTALMRDAFSRLQRATAAFVDEPAVLNYLVNERKLPLPIVREAQRQGMVGFLPNDSTKASKVIVEAVGEELLRKTGLWKPDKKLPGITYRPLVFFLPNLSSAEFRVIGDVKEGTTKSIRYGTLEYPYWWQGSQPQCMIVEGLIDMLSAVALGWKGHVMGLTGCNSFKPEWFVKARDRHQLKRYVVALDNDVEDPKNPGQKWAKKLNEVIQSLGIASFVRSPDNGDINDILKQRAKETA